MWGSCEAVGGACANELIGKVGAAIMQNATIRPRDILVAFFDTTARQNTSFSLNILIPLPTSTYFE